MPKDKPLVILVSGPIQESTSLIADALKAQDEYAVEVVGVNCTRNCYEYMDMDRVRLASDNFDRGHHVTPALNERGLVEHLNLIEREQPNLWIPTIADEMNFLSGHIGRIDLTGILLLMSSHDTINSCNDKVELSRFLHFIGIATPEIIEVKSTYDGMKQLSDLPYPLIVKSRRKINHNVMMVKDIESLTKAYAQVEDPFIQRFIKGGEYMIDTLSDLNGRCLLTVPQKKVRLNRGKAEKVKIYQDAHLSILGKQIVESAGIIGPANIDLIREKTTGIYYVIDVNPRLSRNCYALYHAGVNVPHLVIKMLTGSEISSSCLEFKNGTYGVHPKRKPIFSFL